jgi:hypothetical protein
VGGVQMSLFLPDNQALLDTLTLAVEDGKNVVVDYSKNKKGKSTYCNAENVEIVND